MQIQSYGITDRGVKRTENEDALLIAPSLKLYAVADGLGGLPGGRDASRRLLEHLEEKLEAVDIRTNQQELVPAIEAINSQLREEFFEAHPFTGSGSTLTLALHLGEKLEIAHIGDSSAYRLRAGEFSKLTVDHTMEQEFIRQNGEEARENMPSEYAHTLTQCIGLLRKVDVDRLEAEVLPKDRFLLCSDGLYRALSDTQISEILTDAADPRSASEALVKSANANGGPDNITVIALFAE